MNNTVFTVVALPAKHKNEIRKLLTFRLHSLLADLNYYKEMIAFFWLIADKDKPNTKPHFLNLNHAKERARKLRKELKLIRETLKVLK
jgi:hypothetical protein